jgi:N-acetylmuramoyl-L-alanine amidase
MRRALLALLLVLVAPVCPADAASQPADPHWRVETALHSLLVKESSREGYPALPLTTLASLGGRVSSSPLGAFAQVGGRIVRFTLNSPEFQVGEQGYRLQHPVYRDAGVVFLPVEFFREHLPRLAGAYLTVDPEQRLLRSADYDAALVGSFAEGEDEGDASTVEGDVTDEDRAAVDEDDTLPPAILAAIGAEPPRRRLVVIDAGHGGRDPGATGPGGVREKDVALAIARRLAAVLRRDPTLEVRMTRDRDTLIALRDRPRLANEWKKPNQPALFLSLHLNSNPARSARGFETYFLSEAKTEDARRVEAMENAAERFEDDGDRPLTSLDFIFHDLRQNHYLRESSDWAAQVQARLGTVHPGPNRGVKQAGFAVLNGAFMPAVLVEVGFISNPREERELNTRALQEEIAAQLAAAVREHFAGAPAPARGSGEER